MSTLEAIWDTPGMTSEEVRETLESDLVPKGRWEGQLQPINPDSDVKIVETESKDHPLEGKAVVNCHAVLYTDIGEKHFFFKAYPAKVVATSKKGGQYTRLESVNASMLVKATQMFGRPFNEVLDKAADCRLVFDIGVKKSRIDETTGEEYKASNVLKGIYPASA